MTERSLNGRLALKDVQDVEGLSRKILDVQLRRTHAHLSPLDFDDALAFVIATIYELSLRWSPDYGLTFSTYCWRIGQLRVVDWYRRRFGDSRFGGDVAKSVAQPLSLDAPIRGTNDDDGAAASSLGAALGARPDDRAGDSDADFAGIFGDGAGEDDWRQEVVRHRLAARSSARDRERRRAKQQAAGAEVEVETTAAEASALRTVELDR